MYDGRQTPKRQGKKCNKDWDGWSRLTECWLQMTTFRNVDLDISKWRDRYEKQEEGRLEIMENKLALETSG